ncbi:beta-ketoacyl-ACP synthase II [Gammaproteobacteria bacterium]|jgi:3-oxoacyl-[acyl-carrier-protein] synthase II|nr:beta-ketoacyl-ACP synthase II [Gammaproteobacteria bacterium]MDA8798985.1 beta-ketoacyl-ACP synthase II [Gammaproteobacteria bacterium]MDC0513248.1 beta-ketoacyl-ACP synthase II [Gammaproteobacteria bacterium]MDC0919051.1 beta-ketoacyl-ACP synthase II [Gammaproteobacteria bacterium]|tara:strand:+ start:75 stop:1307 length:1233 start_codon:yes stop_codon:yes gene_type:complete
MKQLHRRVVVTGLGILSPIGNSVDDAWYSCIEGKSGITSVDIGLKNNPVTIGGRLKDFNPENFLDSKEIRRIDPFIQYGIIAANQSIEHSGILESNIDLTKVGVNFGAGIGGIDTIEKNKVLLEEKGYKKVSPFFVPGSIVNMISGLVSIKHGFMGPNTSVVTACSTGNHCIGTAARSIACGEADVMIAGGAEMASTPLSIAGFISARALSLNPNPEVASRPWDKDRDGFVLSDGAGSLVLEDYDHAKARGATIHAEIIGFGASSDAYHMTAPPEDGRGAALAMSNAINDAEINLSEVDYINAHGTSTPLGDIAETIALKKVFGDVVPQISSTKSMTGHTLGAAGAIESIFCIKAINEGIVPPTINLDNPDPLCDLNYTPLVSTEKEVVIAMNNSFGFGGTNSTLVFKKI